MVELMLRDLRECGAHRREACGVHERPQWTCGFCLHNLLDSLSAELARLEAWKGLALNVLTDNQLDFKPAMGGTLRQRLAEIERR